MLATALAVAMLFVGLAVAIASPGTLVDWLFAILLVGAVLAELVAPKVTARFVVSGGFVAGMLAAAFLGPAAAFIVPAAGMLGPWLVRALPLARPAHQPRRGRDADRARGARPRSSSTWATATSCSSSRWRC